jgi:rhamnosyltransferase
MSEREEPSVTIIIRARDDGAFIGEVFDKLAIQTVKGIETLVVYDERSKDDTKKICHQYGAVIIPIPEGKFTFGSSINLGFSHAHGEIVVIMVGHAVPDNEYWLEELISPLLKDSTVAGVFGRQIPQPDAYGYTQRILASDYPSEGVPSPIVFSNVSAAFRHFVWKENQFDEVLSGVEDYAWALKVKKEGYKIEYAPRSVVRHSHRESYAHMVWRAGIVSEAYFSLGLSTRRISYFVERLQMVGMDFANDLRAFLHGQDDLHGLYRAALYHVATLYGNYKAYVRTNPQHR